MMERDGLGTGQGGVRAGGYRTARDVDPLVDFDPMDLLSFDPMQEHWRKWVWKEVDGAWQEATGGTRSPAEARMSDLGEVHTVALILGLESVLKIPVFANIHRFAGGSPDEFVEFVMELATERNRQA